MQQILSNPVLVCVLGFFVVLTLEMVLNTILKVVYMLTHRGCIDVAEDKSAET